VPVSEVRIDPRHKKAAPAKAKRKPMKTALPPIEARAMRTTDNTCDLRGSRVEEGLTQLDEFIDRCLQSSESVAFALHGHGTGAMRSAVREHLKLHGHVARTRPASTEEGGEAFTVFWLRD
jgi:DNA mismatch repair protein MutS2